MSLADDQRYRNEISRLRVAPKSKPATLSKLRKKQHRLNKKNVKKIYALFERMGGYPSAKAAGPQQIVPFLVALHAPLAGQKKLLPYIQKAVEKKEISPIALAHLADRIRVGEGKPQLYGTYVDLDSKPPAFFPIHEPAKVNERRTSVGMYRIEDYARRLGVKYP